MARHYDRSAAALVLAIVFVGECPAAQDPTLAQVSSGPVQRPVAAQTTEATNSSHIRLASKARISVQRAVDGARRRLTTPSCQTLFTDYVDRDGDTLATILAASGQTAEQHLDNLYFVEANTFPQCSGNRIAFTTPGRHVIYVCGARFVPYSVRNNMGAEILVIHELLHSIGLGENPPTSADITDRVRARCGDSR